MKYKWLGAVALMVMLAGCGTPLEEQIETGFTESEAVFNNEAETTNTQIENIELFLPENFKVQQSEVENNYLLTNDRQQYVLFVNEFEDSDSKLYYEQLQAKLKDKIVEEKTFTKDGIFGFSAVVEVKDDEFECITSIGGVKMTTLTEAKAVDEKLTTMMNIVASVKMAEKQ